MLQVLNSLSTDARGLILTMITGASAVATDVADKAIGTSHLEPLQQIALITTIIVASMTIISYLYRFFKWTKKCFTESNNK